MSGRGKIYFGLKDGCIFKVLGEGVAIIYVCASMYICFEGSVHEETANLFEFQRGASKKLFVIRGELAKCYKFCPILIPTPLLIYNHQSSSYDMVMTSFYMSMA